MTQLLTDTLGPFAAKSEDTDGKQRKTENPSLSPDAQEPNRPETDRLREQARSLQVLQNLASCLVPERDVHRAVKLITDHGCELTGAGFGAFFYNVEDDERGSYMLYTLSGVPREAFVGFPMPRNTEIFEPTFSGREVVRLSDVTQDPRYGRNTPYDGMPPGHLPVRSYLAVPVKSKAGKVIGGIFFGHQEAGKFGPETEKTSVVLAAYAAMAIENANLDSALQRELAALREAEYANRHMASIVQSSDDAIVSKTLEGIVLSWNEGAHRIFGYTAEEMIGSPVTRIFPPTHLSEEQAILARLRRGERIDHYETVRMRKDGTLLDVSLTVSPILDESGQIIGASKIARDITLRKRQEEALQRINAELQVARNELEVRVEERTRSLKEAIGQMEEFSYTVSHDLRAPLRAMSVYSSFLNENFRHLFEAEPEALRSVERIAENCVRLDRMIQEVLAYGRIARAELLIEPVALDGLLSETIKAFPTMQEPNARVVSEPLGRVMAHLPSISQILSNLLTNAVKFVPEGVQPQVHLWTERHDGLVRLWIEDNGIGIEPKHQHRLFTMFERIHPRSPYEGTGVGLAIVRKATERMGGRVGVESDGVHGSRFWVELPAVSDEEGS